MTKTKFFVEATPLVEERMSGVGHALAGLVDALSQHEQFMRQYDVVLVVPQSRGPLLQKWDFAKKCQTKELPVKRKIINGLIRLRMLPTMDILLGKGVYLFGNYRNWPLSKNSYSYTYIYDISFVLYPEFVSPRNLKMLIKNIPRFFKQANMIVTISETSRQEIRDHYHIPNNDIMTLYCGYNEKLYRPYSATQIERVKKKYGIQKQYIIYIGNIEPRKNLERLVQAYERLPHSLQEQYALVLIGGDGWLNEAIHKSIDHARGRGLAIIKPTSYVPDEDVAPLIRGAKLLIHPALHEGFGITPLEALASDTPVVASNIPVLKEVLGEAAHYFNPADIADMAKQIERALTDDILRRTLIKKGQERKKLFRWSITAQKLYEHLTSHKPSA